MSALMTRATPSDQRAKTVGSAIFGDGSAAAVIEKGTTGPTVAASKVHQIEGTWVIMQAPGRRTPPSAGPTHVAAASGDARPGWGRAARAPRAGAHRAAQGARRLPARDALGRRVRGGREFGPRALVVDAIDDQEVRVLDHPLAKALLLRGFGGRLGGSGPCRLCSWTPCGCSA
jgi:hypothetical protein